MNNDPDGLVTVATAANDFEAATIVAVLKEAGIEAVAMETATSALGIGLSGGGMGVPVQVRAGEADRAREVLRRNVADSVDLDWDEVDVGRADDASGAEGAPMPRSMEWALRAAMVAIALLVLVMVWAAARFVARH